MQTGEMTMSTRAFLSYHRSSSKWIAYAIKESLISKGVDVFLDVKDINSGRFKNVIHNEIAKRDNFIVVLSLESCRKLDSEQDWVRRELELASELKKNIIPVLVDGATIRDVPSRFPNREMIVSLSALNISFDYSEEAMNNLYNRYLMNPTIQELEFEVAEEHYKKGFDAQNQEDWRVAEIEFEKAVSRLRRPDYLLGLAVAKHKQARNEEALNDIDAAIAVDPFGWELMNTKFKLLQEMDKMQEALDLPSQWESQAQSRANAYARRILAGVENGLNLMDSVMKIPQLTFMHAEQSGIGMVAACIDDISGHLSGETKENMVSAFREWSSKEIASLHKPKSP